VDNQAGRRIKIGQDSQTEELSRIRFLVETTVDGRRNENRIDDWCRHRNHTQGGFKVGVLRRARQGKAKGYQTLRELPQVPKTKNAQHATYPRPVCLRPSCFFIVPRLSRPVFLFFHESGKQPATIDFPCRREFSKNVPFSPPSPGRSVPRNHWSRPAVFPQPGLISGRT
jgi:hypothetical protein